MNIKILAALIGLTFSSSALTQNATIAMPDFTPLQAKATDCVNISLGPWLIHAMASFLDEKDPEDAAAKQLLSGIRSIQVHSFEFASDAAYSRADVDAVRRQLNAPGWTSMMNVHDRDSGEDVDMYMLIEDEQTRGFALLSSKPREITIINIVGSIKMSDLPKLRKQLHVNKLIAARDVLEWPAAAKL